MKPLLFFCYVTFCLGALSCKKDHGSATPVISYQGLPIKGGTIYFFSNEGSTFKWDFGDSTVSDEAKPSHVYQHSGTFTIKLTVNNNNAYRLDTFIVIYNDPVYTHEVTGTYNFHHFYSTYIEGHLPDTTVYSDTAFMFSYVDPLTISAGSITYDKPYVANDSTIVFFHDYLFDNIHISGSHDAVYFNHIEKKISLIRHYHWSAGSYAEEYFYSY